MEATNIYVNEKKLLQKYKIIFLRGKMPIF